MLLINLILTLTLKRLRRPCDGLTLVHKNLARLVFFIYNNNEDWHILEDPKRFYYFPSGPNYMLEHSQLPEKYTT